MNGPTMARDIHRLAVVTPHFWRDGHRRGTLWGSPTSFGRAGGCDGYNGRIPKGPGPEHDSTASHREPDSAAHSARGISAAAARGQADLAGRGGQRHPGFLLEDQ